MHSSTARAELNLTTLASRRQLHLAQCMFRCLSSLSPPYLSKLFSYPSRPGTRSTSTRQVNLPNCRTSFGQKAFSFAGASLWRSLPQDVRAAEDLQSFSKLFSASVTWLLSWLSIITLRLLPYYYYYYYYYHHHHHYYYSIICMDLHELCMDVLTTLNWTYLLIWLFIIIHFSFFHLYIVVLVFVLFCLWVPLQ